MTPPPWHITDSAVARYAHARGWHVSGDYHSIPKDIRDRCEGGLEEVCKIASYRARDRYGRELWRTPKRTGGGLRIVIDPREGPTAAIIWCGYGAPPARVFAP